MTIKISAARPLALIAGLAAVGLTACGGSPSPSASNEPAPSVTVSDAPADAHEADLAAREQALAAKESELAMKQKEQDLAQREAALAKKEAASKAAARQKSASSMPKPTATLATTNPLKVTSQPQTSPKRMPITVPAGTLFSVNLSSDVSTKTAKVGDPIDARLAQDLVVNGRTALAAGSPVRGTVTQVVSGSHKIGGVPTLAMTFDKLELENGQTVAINGKVVQQGKSETGKDTAKIVGGAAAGAIIGHQIGKDDKGTVIGGLLGGAAGAVAAQKTGGEVNVPAGTTVTFSTDAPFKVGS
jgi:Glycine zipper 2TM domain